MTERAVIVTPTQVRAARLLVKLRADRGADVEPIIRKIAEASTHAEESVTAPSHYPLTVVHAEHRFRRTGEPAINQSGSEKTWDVFISHASADKEEIARPLYQALTDLGCSVWFDEMQLQVGESLRTTVDQGLRSSAFGVVILSPAFFAQSWPKYELDSMVSSTRSGMQNILPIWHKVSKDEVQTHSPALADRVARSTADWTIAEIAHEIAMRVRPDLFSESR